MNFEPKNFFVGLIDFFSVLLPGAVLTYLLKADLQQLFLLNPEPQFSELEGWAVFLFSSYLLGHFIFLIGSFLDTPYYEVRIATEANQIKNLSKGGSLASPFNRRLSKLLVKNEHDKALDLAIKIKEYYLNPLLGASTINTFQWGKGRLIMEAPEAAAAVQRFEADQKFFRSLFVVLVILFLWGIAKGWPVISEIFILLLMFGSFWRYFEQRLKSTNQVYSFIITQESAREGGFRQMESVPEDGMTHAGGVVYRQESGLIKYLLVETSKEPKQWVLPKGHINSGEKMGETAVREVREETGVWASVAGVLPSVNYSVRGEMVKVQFYLMKYLEHGKPSDRNRKTEWLPYEQAITKLEHQENCDLLSAANMKLRA